MHIADLNTKTRFLTKTDTVSLPAATLLILINNAYERVVSLIMKSDGRWEWDDDNQSDLPIATTTLTTDQQDYSLAVTHLAIKRVEMKDTTGIWTDLFPIHEADLRGISITEFFKTSSIPNYYDKLGNSVFIYPAPDFTQTASLKVWFQRPPALYTSAEVTTGTKVPGFNSLYHDLISYYAAHEYALANGLPNANQLMASILQKEEALVSDYSARSKDENMRLRVRKSSSR